MNLRLPYINARSLQDEIQQIKSYLFQTIEQINIETNSTEPITKENIEEIITKALKPLEERIRRLEVKINQ